MGTLTFYAGLLLPWLGGALWLAYAGARYGPQGGNRWSQLGYGFFLGYAVLYFSVLACKALAGSVVWLGVMTLLGCFAAAGAVALYLATRGPASHRRPAEQRLGREQKTLLALLLAWISLHLAFICIEVFTQPLYPWDAWLAWVYRAKAWFMAGGMTNVVSPAQWALARTADNYTIQAWTYPLFPSVIPYWAALSLGRWSETLVNVPTLFAGLAIGMALYGQLRQYGLGIAAGALACYLLYSIPLFGTHIALAGYADLWMAGFCGLGFIYVLRGSIARRSGASAPGRIVPGLLMLAMSAAVKNEGVVWFLSALVVLLLANARLRITLILLLLLLLITTLCAAFGVSHLDIPLIGAIGFVDGRLLLPFIGSFRIEPHDVWKVYAENFFIMGSWNLFAFALVAGLALAVQRPLRPDSDQARRTGLAFIGLVIAMQLFIFGLTDEGLWADTYTAINRLVLHFVPPLLFTVFVVVRSRLDDGWPQATASTADNGRVPALRLAATAVTAALVVAGGAAYVLSRDLPAPAPAPKHFAAADFGFAFGHGEAAQGHILVDQFANGYALLTSGPVSIEAEDYPAIEYTWLPSAPGQQAAFFWRRKGDENVQREDLVGRGTALLDLSSLQQWQGEISELGFLLQSPGGQSVQLGAATLEPASLALRLRLVWQGWSRFEEWSQQSINFLRGGADRQPLSLPFLISAWLLLTLLLLCLPGVLPKRRSAWLRAAIAMFCVAWMLLDLRWTVNNVRQSRLSLQVANLSADQRAAVDLDGQLHRFIERLKEKVLKKHPARILILGGPDSVDYYLLRAKYHLLPHSAFVTRRLGARLQPANLDYVIYLGQPGTITQVPGWNSRWRDSLLEIDKSGMGVVYRVRPD